MLSKPEENLIKIYENSFRKNWELEAVTDYGTSNTLTYAKLAENIAKVHLLFEQAGIEVVDSVASVATNSKDKPKTAVVIESITFVKPIEKK